jgi:hypothetical protein
MAKNSPGLNYDIPALIESFKKSGGFPGYGTSGPGNFDVAKFILTQGNIKWDNVDKVTESKESKQNKSTLSRVLDILSRGNYASATMFDRFVKHNTTVEDPKTGRSISLDEAQGRPDNPWYEDLVDILHGGVSGLAGTQKNTFTKLIADQNRYRAPWNHTDEKRSKAVTLGAGLLADVALDPLSYLGMGPLKIKNIPGVQHVPGLNKLPSVKQKYGTDLLSNVPKAADAPQLSSKLSIVPTKPGEIQTNFAKPGNAPIPGQLGAAFIPPPAPTESAVSAAPDDFSGLEEILSRVTGRTQETGTPFKVEDTYQNPRTSEERILREEYLSRVRDATKGIVWGSPEYRKIADEIAAEYNKTPATSSLPSTPAAATPPPAVSSANEIVPADQILPAIKNAVPNYSQGIKLIEKHPVENAIRNYEIGLGSFDDVLDAVKNAPWSNNAVVDAISNIPKSVPKTPTTPQEIATAIKNTVLRSEDGNSWAAVTISHALQEFVDVHQDVERFIQRLQTHPNTANAFKRMTQKNPGLVDEIRNVASPKNTPTATTRAAATPPVGASKPAAQALLPATTAAASDILAIPGRTLSPAEIRASVGNVIDEFPTNSRIDRARGVATAEEVRELFTKKPKEAARILANLAKSRGYNSPRLAGEFEKILREAGVGVNSRQSATSAYALLDKINDVVETVIPKSSDVENLVKKVIVNASKGGRTDTRAINRLVTKAVGGNLPTSEVRNLVSTIVESVAKSAKSKGAKSQEKVAAQTIVELLDEIKSLPLNEKGIQQALKADADNIKRLADSNLQRSTSASLGKPLVSYKKSGDIVVGVSPNVPRATEIVEKIAAGDIKTLSTLTPKTPTGIAAPSSQHIDEGVNAAEEYAEAFFRGKGEVFQKNLNMPIAQANFFQNYLLTDRAVKFLNPNIKKPYAKQFQDARFLHAYRMLKPAEDYLASIGKPPVYYDGTHMRLSDVIDELGGPTKIKGELFTQLMKAWKTKDPSKIDNPEIRAAIEKLRALDAVRSAQWVNKAVTDTVKAVNVAEQVLSPARMKAFQESQISQVAKQLENSGAVSPAGLVSYKTLAANAFRAQLSGPQRATQRAGKSIQAYTVPGQSGVKWASIQRGQTAAIGDVIGESAAAIGQSAQKQGKWMEWFGTRFQTFYGQKDFRPDTLLRITTAINSAALRNNMWQDVATRFPKEDITESFRLAQGGVPLPNTPPELIELSQRFQKSLESLFSSSGLSEKAQQASTVALRSGMLMQDLNKQLSLLGSDIVFTNSKKVLNKNHQLTPGASKFVSYAKGSDWLKSWENMDVPNPVEFMMRVEQAVEQLMHQYTWMDEVAAHFGSPVRTSVFSGTVNANRLKGVYFDPRISSQLQRALDTWSQAYNPKSQFIKNYDQVLRSWKTLITIPLPSHHVRNLIGDVYLSVLAGVNNQMVYKTAVETVMSQRHRYKPLKEGGLNDFMARQQQLESLVGQNAVQKSISGLTTSESKKAFTTRGGLDVSYATLYTIAHNNGLLTTARAIEEIVGDPLISWKPFDGKVANTLYGISEVREHVVRLAHLADAMKKSKGKDLAEIGREAAKEVRRWHPDGLDLTKFERETMRRIIPFYSWTRKAIPLVLESLVTRPGKVMLYPKAMHSAQVAMGVDSQSAGNPFPGDQLFPDWIRSKGIGPMFGSGENDNYQIVNPSNPTLDLISQFGGAASGDWQSTLRGIAGMATPALKIPFEVTSGYNSQGIPIDYDTSRYLTEQIPIAAPISRVTNYDFMGQTERGKEQGSPNVPGLLNLLFALGLVDTGNYIQTSRFEERERQ